MNTLAFASIAQLQEMLLSKKISQEELLHFFMRRFEAFDGDLGSTLELFGTPSTMHASQQKGILQGIPGIVKANICMKGKHTSCASRMLSSYTAVYDATAVECLVQSGAVILGYANMDEFAMGSSTETSAFKKTKNPWNPQRVPGGSSGGSAAAVAAGLIPWSLGSDTGGSVRQPAAFCGVVGLKPTYGRVSRYGLVAYGSSLDQIGVITRTVKDNALVFSAIAGHDTRDSSSISLPTKDYVSLLQDKLPKNIRIGIIENALEQDGTDSEIVEAITNAINVFEHLGARISHVKIPMLAYSTAAYIIISRAEAASNLARFDGVRYGMRYPQASSLHDMYTHTRHDGFGQEVKTRILIGNYVLSAGHAGEFYQNAKKVQHAIRVAFDRIFKEVDILIMPTHPVPAFSFGAYDINKLQMDLQDYFTCPMNLAGIPALSIPCGLTKNRLPIGLQLIGPHLSEELLYQVGHVYEQNTEWHTQHPEGF